MLNLFQHLLPFYNTTPSQQKKERTRVPQNMHRRCGSMIIDYTRFCSVNTGLPPDFAIQKHCHA